MPVEVAFSSARRLPADVFPLLPLVPGLSGRNHTVGFPLVIDRASHMFPLRLTQSVSIYQQRCGGARDRADPGAGVISSLILGAGSPPAAPAPIPPRSFCAGGSLACSRPPQVHAGIPSCPGPFFLLRFPSGFLSRPGSTSSNPLPLPRGVPLFRFTFCFPRRCRPIRSRCMDMSAPGPVSVSIPIPFRGPVFVPCSPCLHSGPVHPSLSCSIPGSFTNRCRGPFQVPSSFLHSPGLCLGPGDIAPLAQALP